MAENGERAIMREENKLLVWTVRLLIPALVALGWKTTQDRIGKVEFNQEQRGIQLNSQSVEIASLRAESRGQDARLARIENKLDQILQAVR